MKKHLPFTMKEGKLENLLENGDDGLTIKIR